MPEDICSLAYSIPVPVNWKYKTVKLSLEHFNLLDIYLKTSLVISKR